MQNDTLGKKSGSIEVQLYHAECAQEAIDEEDRRTADALDAAAGSSFEFRTVIRGPRYESNDTIKRLEPFMDLEAFLQTKDPNGESDWALTITIAPKS